VSFDAEMRGCAASSRSEYSGPVRIIDDQECSLAFAERYHSVEWRKVAVHRVHAFHAHEHVTVPLAGGIQDLLKMPHVVVAELDRMSGGQLDSVHPRRVTELIKDDCVVPWVDKSGSDAAIGSKSRRED
jgi:hypothetical protein